MGKTLRQWLESIEDDATRKKALDNIDERYADTLCHTIGMAVMLGVHHHEKFEDKQFWQAFQVAEIHKAFPDCSEFYKKQEVQQEDHSGKKK